MVGDNVSDRNFTLCMSSVDVHIKAQGVARGVAVGKAVCLYGRRRQYFHTNLNTEQIDRELMRFRASIRLAIRQLGHLGTKNGSRSTENVAGILDTHRMMLSDPVMIGEIEQKIGDEQINAEWAVKLVTDRYLAQYKSLADERFRERYKDQEDVTERILSALGGGRRTHKVF
jgi:phosphotransferase system enzyme I (PtsI)